MRLEGVMYTHPTGKLRRSKTITTDTVKGSNWYDDNPPSHAPGQTSPNGNDYIPNQNGTGDGPSYRPVPGPSCKALRHAVSTLSRLDDFISEKLGEGFFAEVFKVTHRTTGEVQVLKMNKVQGNRPNVLRELQLMNRLSHVNILRFIGVCVHEGQLHALTEDRAMLMVATEQLEISQYKVPDGIILYINGGDLEQLLANKAVELPWTVRVKIAHDIACGMTYLHSRGIMHRDLTSKNVLIRQDAEGYTAVVGDFGLSAKIPDPLSNKQLSTVGSPFWMAPEVICGRSYNEKADVFSYGIICCEITARVSSDPDELPRTQSFGVDYKAFSELVDYCPLDFLRLAFRCCQMNACQRPTFSEAETSTQQLYENLENDNVSHYGRERRNSTDGSSSSYKRSRSEDNILQAGEDDSFEGELDEALVDEPFESPVTPVLIGEAMSRDDPYYQPSSNPFANMEGYWDGNKILGKSFGDVDSMMFELPSPSSPTTPPCTPLASSFGSSRRGRSFVPRSQSLPSSPVLLRKAAERLHQESIHGSNSKKSINTNRFSFSAYGSKSKNMFFPEAVAQKLQYEMYDTGSPYNGRSREGSVESENNLNFTYPFTKTRRHSNLDASPRLADERVQSHQISSGSSNSSSTLSRQDSVDEAGENYESVSFSVYPSLKYAPDAKHEKKSIINNNNNETSSSVDCKVSCEDASRTKVVFKDLDENEPDPWKMKRETLKDTAIVEETPLCQTGIMETSV